VDNGDSTQTLVDLRFSYNVTAASVGYCSFGKFKIALRKLLENGSLKQTTRRENVKIDQKWITKGNGMKNRAKCNNLISENSYQRMSEVNQPASQMLACCCLSLFSVNKKRKKVRKVQQIYHR
jgi:hypothetical protein